MRENLIGYLLGVLDADEHAEVGRELKANPDLQFECELLQRSMMPLHADHAAIVPPKSLTEMTCQYVQEESSRLHADVHIPLASQETPLPQAAPAEAVMPADQLGSAENGSWIDFVAFGGIAAALALLLFPAVICSHFQADLQACQNNLRRLGSALTSYSDLQGGVLPAVPPEGKRAVAGIYAPLLSEGEFIEASYLVCPSHEVDPEEEPYRIPTLEEIDAASGRELAHLQRTMGGDYGYTLGYHEGGRVVPVANLGRDHFAVMADVPSPHQGDRQSNNHGGHGQNVLYEGGAVRYLVDCQSDDCGDQVFVSDRGFVEAGLHADDAVIGSSASRPVLSLIHLPRNGM